MLRNLECPIGLSQKRICAHFSQENLAQFGQSAKKLKVELRNGFGFSGPKVAHYLIVQFIGKSRSPMHRDITVELFFFNTGVR